MFICHQYFVANIAKTLINREYNFERITEISGKLNIKSEGYIALEWDYLNLLNQMSATICNFSRCCGFYLYVYKDVTNL